MNKEIYNSRSGLKVDISRSKASGEKRSLRGKLLRWGRFVYLKVFRINDTPHKIALGIGIGVFMGVLPGVGPVTALLVAWFFRANRAAALLGSLLTNTWSLVPLSLVSLQAGSWLTGVRGGDIAKEWTLLRQDFHWSKLLEAATFKMIWPILAGFLGVALSISLLSYGIAWILTIQIQKNRQRRLN